MVYIWKATPGWNKLTHEHSGNISVELLISWLYLKFWTSFWVLGFKRVDWKKSSVLRLWRATHRRRLSLSVFEHFVWFQLKGLIKGSKSIRWKELKLCLWRTQMLNSIIIQSSLVKDFYKMLVSVQIIWFSFTSHQTGFHFHVVIAWLLWSRWLFRRTPEKKICTYICRLKNC